jgi:hypothetical protein
VTIHLLDFQRGRANVYRAWTACGKTASSRIVSRYRKHVTCEPCLKAPVPKSFTTREIDILPVEERRRWLRTARRRYLRRKKKERAA